MNRLLQHFVDSSGAQPPPATRPSIPVPPQSSGGSSRAGHRGSFQRTIPNGPYYYQPPQPPNGLEEIPLTSHSTGAIIKEGNRYTTLNSASELFASGPPPTRTLSSSNPYRRQSSSSSTLAMENVAMSGIHWSPQNGNINAGEIDPFSIQSPESNIKSQEIPRQAVDPFVSTVPSRSHSFHSPPLTNEVCQSADTLFTSSKSLNTTKWVPFPNLQSKTPLQAQEAFANDPPSASSLFSGSFSQTSALTSQTTVASPSELQISTPSSSSIYQVNTGVKSSTHVELSSPMKPPLASSPSVPINASSPPPSPQDTCPTSPDMRPEDHVSSSMMPLYPRKSSLKSGLDMRHMKFVAGKRDDDAISNAPSLAPSRMSMLSTLDDSLKLSDMYKHMATRLESEKHDLLKVVARQAQEMAQMQKHIQSLELQLKKSRLQDA
ncbi:uncharacterized protein PHALS_06956 [Plasmopara halstedii]|uniref:Uncharacterized protein n=1 Tax=Plasmopara halstedii TaxID=4781 RepID=A0A0N7L886_PLAHL|nr:uncharacterized protein PHALS_06956 [Plasmopara halstedii]CEG49179.1 hypothetical protein PHALS_06956 [Plasmopara halstedii]|eukprot:XP_024585548.1 hypothetical protein PHALS_06956 [Plasmopara halstedii]